MSSHHIVREKQEPALFINALGDFDEEYLGQILEWSPSIIVPLHLFEKVISMGIKVDVVLANGVQNLSVFQEHVKVIPYRISDLDTALNHLVSEGFPSVNIITDRFEANEYQPYVNLIDLVIFKDNQKIYPIRSGFSKWKTEGERIFVLQAIDVEQPTTTGLKAINALEYRTEKDGFFSFVFDKPFLFIAEEI